MHFLAPFKLSMDSFIALSRVTSPSKFLRFPIYRTLHLLQIRANHLTSYTILPTFSSLLPATIVAASISTALLIVPAVGVLAISR
jgi:hypothetical protein